MILSAIGIHKYEEQIYVALLNMGQANMSEIVDRTGLHRPTVYKHIYKLIELNLACETKVGKRKYYHANNPTVLNKMAEKVPSQINTYVDDLLDIYKKSQGKPEIQWFQGEQVVTWVYEDVLYSCKKGDVFYRYESPKDFKQLDEYLPSSYFERVCHKKEIEKFVITNEKTAKTKPSVLERVSKYVPLDFDIFDYDITQILYADKVAFIDFTNKSAWIVENSRFAHFQKRLFQLLFKNLE